jgi:bifunctional ADP-heptose synthase (sugar kinase/adenylyltransferase)
MQTKLGSAKEWIAGFADKRILVIGDLMLDEFIWGQVSRISPEAENLITPAAPPTWRATSGNSPRARR